MNRLKILPSSLMLLLFVFEANGQYFGRNSVQLPSLGWMALDSSLGSFNQEVLGVADQIQIGTGYARDLLNLQWWWVNETAIGFAKVDAQDLSKSRTAITFQASSGIKHNLLSEFWRPFFGFMLEIFQIFNLYDRNIPYEGDFTFMWASARPMVGVEWIFTSDMSIEIEGGYVLLYNFEDPIRHSAMTRVSYRTYF